jgi:predicted ribonuclease toxin of YeeF-YezG toxin-antitoxin module
MAESFDLEETVMLLNEHVARLEAAGAAIDNAAATGNTVAEAKDMFKAISAAAHEAASTLNTYGPDGQVEPEVVAAMARTFHAIERLSDSFVFLAAKRS